MLRSYKLFLGEFLGTCFLVTSIVGSGIMASNLTSDKSITLLINAISTVFALVVLINLFSNLTGSHFNPVVTVNAFIQKDLNLQETLLYISAQIMGAFCGSILANIMYSTSAFQISGNNRAELGTFIGEFVATLGLLVIVKFRSSQAASLVPLWIGSAYFFTSSTSFANPAVTFGRIFSDSFSGISPKSAFLFALVQIATFFLLTISTTFWRRLDDK